MLRATRILFIAIACAAGCTTGGADDGGDDGGACEPWLVTAPTAAACAAATRTCLDACQDDACVDGCFAAEPDPDGCGGCLDDAYVSCANAAGCQPAWDAADCCIQDCADPEAEACYTATCAAELDAYDACFATKASCASAADVCFP